MRTLAVLAALCGIVGAGCFGTGPSEVAAGEEFVLAPNQSARIAGTELTVGFRRVAGDSRCPIDAACLVEGNAEIELNVFGVAASNPVLVSTPLPTSWTDGTYQIQIKLVDLLPHPTTSRRINPDEYRLRLQVDLIPHTTGPRSGT